MYSIDPKNAIAGWSFSSTEIGNALSARQLINPSLDLSNPCNLNCAYCFIEEKSSARKHRRPNELTIAETKQLIAVFVHAGARTINIVGAGEPTIDPAFREIVSLISSLGLTSVVFTNGIRIADDPELASFLFSAGASVVLKFNTFDNQLQDLVAGRDGFSEKRNQALQYLLEEGFAEPLPTRLGLDMIVFAGSLREIPQIHAYCRGRNVFPIAAEFIPTGRTEGGDFVGEASVAHLESRVRQSVRDALRPITREQRQALLEEIGRIDKAFGVRPASAAAYFGGAACTQLLGLYVDIEGRIWPCVARKRRVNGRLIGVPLGNVRQGDDLRRIWASDPYLEDLRNSYNGACPYKESLNIRCGEVDGREFEEQRELELDGLVQIGRR